MLRTHGQAAVLVLVRQLADRPLVQRHAELARDAIAQINTPPADHTIPRQIWTGLNPFDQRLLLFFCQHWLPSRSMSVGETVQAAVVVSVHPVSQRLTVHSGHPSRLFTRGTLHHQRNRQRSPHRPRIPHPSRPGAQFRSRQIQPSDRYSHRHPREPTPPAIESQILSAGKPPRRVKLTGRWYNKLRKNPERSAISLASDAREGLGGGEFGVFRCPARRESRLRAGLGQTPGVATPRHPAALASGSGCRPPPTG